MDYGIYAGDTDKTIYLRLRDSTTGLAKTGLAYNSAGAVCSYTLPRAARAAITLATQTVTGAHSDGGFVEVDATNCKGLYRLDLPDAAIASGAFTCISIEFDGTIEETVLVPLHTRKVNTIEVGGTTQTARDIGASVLLSSGTGAGQISLTSGLVKLAATTHTGAIIPTVTTLTGHTAQTGDTYALANGANGFAATKADTAAILLDTGTDGVVVAAASKTGYSLTATTGLGNQTANITGSLSGSVGSVAGAVGSVTGAVGSVTGSVGSVTGNVGGNVTGSVGSVLGGINTSAGTIQTLDALDAAQDAAHATTQGKIDTVDGIVDAILLDTAEIGAAGAGLSAVPWNAAWDAEVQSEVADGLAAFWTSPATLVDLVWDEALSGHADAGSTGAALSAAGGSGDPWSTVLPGAYGAGTAGYILGTNLDATVSSRSSQTSVDTVDGIVDAILLDTNDLQTNQGNWVTATGFSTLTQADIRTAVGLASANLDTQLADLPTVAEFEARTLVAASYFDPAADTVARVTLVDTTTTNADMRGTESAATAADVNAQVLDVINVDTLVAGVTIAEAIRRIGTITSGKVADAGSGTETFTDWANSASTIIITVDGSGNRSAITYN